MFHQQAPGPLLLPILEQPFDLGQLPASLPLGPGADRSPGLGAGHGPELAATAAAGPIVLAAIWFGHLILLSRPVRTEAAVLTVVPVAERPLSGCRQQGDSAGSPPPVIVGIGNQERHQTPDKTHDKTHDTRKRRTMRIIALIDHGPAWDRSKTIYQQGPAMDAHLAAMGNRYDEGQLLIGGPFENAPGGVAVLDAPDLSAAQSIMDSDPAVVAGVLIYQLRVVRAYFDAFSRLRTAGPTAGLGPTAGPAGGSHRDRTR